MPFPCPRSHHRDRATQFWNDWAQISPYSPYNLRHLRQPVPSDLSADAAADAQLFGFEDAFEDLLAVTSSQPKPLLDLRHHAAYKREIRAAFPTGEPPMLWVDRLRTRGLLHPRGGPGGGPPRPFGMWGGGDWRSRPGARAVDDRGFDEEGSGPVGWEAVRDWRRRRAMVDPHRSEEQAGKDDRDWEYSRKLREEKSKESERALLRELERSRRRRAENETPPTNLPWGPWRMTDGKEQNWEQLRQQPQQQQQQQPDTEEDLFSSMESAFTRAEGSVRGLFQVFMDDANTNAQASQMKPGPPKSVVEAEEQRNEFGGKTVTTTTERVDMFGYVHQRTDVQKTDAEGRRVSSETRYDVRPGPPGERHASLPRQAESSDATAAQDSKRWSSEAGTAAEDKPTGWFWR